jgi:pterin-4a-carbinolamine dehydratase
MSEEDASVPRWQRQNLPPMLSQRFEFANYGETRRFLDSVAKVAEEANLHPSLSFGKTYVSVSIDADGQPIGPAVFALARRIDALVENPA